MENIFLSLILLNWNPFCTFFFFPVFMLILWLLLDWSSPFARPFFPFSFSLISFVLSPKETWFEVWKNFYNRTKTILTYKFENKMTPTKTLKKLKQNSTTGDARINNNTTGIQFENKLRDWKMQFLEFMIICICITESVREKNRKKKRKLPLESLHRFNEIDEIGISLDELVDLFLCDSIFEFRQQNVLHHAFRFPHHLIKLIGR